MNPRDYENKFVKIKTHFYDKGKIVFITKIFSYNEEVLSFKFLTLDFVEDYILLYKRNFQLFIEIVE